MNKNIKDIINLNNITRVEYIEHQEHPCICYRGPKKFLWFKFEEYWYEAFSSIVTYRDELSVKYPEYILDKDNNLVRKDPVLIVHFTDRTTVTYKKNADRILSSMMVENPNFLIIYN